MIRLITSTLALASLVLMASYAKNGTEALPIEELSQFAPAGERAEEGWILCTPKTSLEHHTWHSERSDGAPSSAAVTFWVRQQITTFRNGEVPSEPAGSLIQLIVSRDGRMAGAGVSPMVP